MKKTNLGLILRSAFLILALYACNGKQEKKRKKQLIKEIKLLNPMLL